MGEAIAEASPVLADRVRRIVDGHQRQIRECRRVVLAVLRYVLRTRSRATPFGLFAGVAPARTGSTTVRWGRNHRAHVRADAVWLDRIITSLERCDAVRHRLRVVTTNLARVRDDRLTVTSQQRTDHDGPIDTSLRYTRAVDIALRSAEAPVLVADVVDELQTAFPGTSAATIERMVGDLIEQRILITNLRPPMTTTDPVDHVVSELDSLDPGGLPGDAAALIDSLREVRFDITRHNAAMPPSEPAELRESLAARMSSLAPDTKAVSVDLRADCTVSLPEPVWREAESAVEALTRLSPHPYGSAEWADYHHRFLERYGPGAHVPVRDLLDPDTGLGYPAGYRGSLLSTPQQGVSERDVRLLSLAQQASLEHRTEVHLDESMVTALAEPSEFPRRPHCEVSFRVYATNPKEIDQGEFTLGVSGISRAAGTMNGRFVDMFTESERANLTGAYRELPTLSRDALPVQISCPPLHTRTHNVARAPGVLPDVLSLGEHSTDRMGIDDIAVTGDLDRLYLVLHPCGTVIEPFVTNAVEFSHHTHPLARFLAEITTARTATLAPFDWGEVAGRLPYLPRIRYQRSVLAPARWKVAPWNLPHSADWQHWLKALTAWRERFLVPAHVHLGDGDQRLYLNLDEPTHQQILRNEAERSEHLTLREAPRPGSFDWIDGHAHEFVAPLTSTEVPRTTSRVRKRSPIIVRGHQHGHLPGDGQWLYARLFGHPDRQTRILTQHLPRLLAQWGHPPEWWFLRYEDPEPHLRVRIRLDNRAEFGTATARLGSWAADLRRRGLLGGMTLDTYRPETGRFGSGTAMTAAESVFAADSAAATAQLRTTFTSTFNDAITAASMVNLTLSYLGTTEEGARWLIEHVPRASTPAPDRQLRDQTLELATPHDQWAALRALPEGGDTLATWRTRARAINTYRQALTSPHEQAPSSLLRDLLHLHHVRMIGIDPKRERACLHLARAAALSITNRRPRGTA